MEHKACKGDTGRMKFIIMAGGNYDYWETPKQMIEIKGEPIVARTIRLLRETGVKDIAISSNNPTFKQLGVPVLNNENNTMQVHNKDDVEGYWVDCFYPMEEPVCYLMGDVVFSPEAIKTIVEYETDDIAFFGSKKPFADIYPKPWREPFGFKVVDQKRFRKAINEVKSLHSAGVFKRHPIAWELWAVIQGTPPNKINKHYVSINDYTCDIDSPKDIPIMEKIMGE
jgi:hypothetical protein